MLKEVKLSLREYACDSHAAVSQRFFKTGLGDYGEGDLFIGVKVPQVRQIAKRYQNLPLEDAESLLRSEIHEERLLALIILTAQIKKGTEAEHRRIYRLYLANANHVNNWDLVDTSAEHIVGSYLINRSRKPLYRLASSGNLWERRIAILATLCFIRQDDFGDTLRIAKMLLRDDEDLIHKAVGWMLREVGKRDLSTEEGFLDEHAAFMPRTMLRYAIERFPEQKRRKYMGTAASARKR